MTNEELVQLYQSGNEKALNKLIEQNEGIIYKLANKFYTEKTNSIDIEDLQQEGFMGIIMAAEKYDFNNPKKAIFITYAVFWIYQKMNRYVNQRNTNDEISLNVPAKSDGDKELMDYIEGVDYSFENVEEKIYNSQLRHDLNTVMVEYNSLKEREVLKLRYGWDTGRALTFVEVGELINETKVKVRQIEDKALRKLRNSLWARKKHNELREYGYL